jgi:hypothetical protein
MSGAQHSAATAKPPLHTREKFSFVVKTSLGAAWPLFGAHGERAWAAGWDPAFIYPAKPIDQEGMVFTVSRGERKAVWVNTAFDRKSGRIQYVYVIADLVVTVITLHLAAVGEATRVDVTYERTALSDAAHGQVKRMAELDRQAGEQWSEEIENYLLDRRHSES